MLVVFCAVVYGQSYSDDEQFNVNKEIEHLGKTIDSLVADSSYDQIYSLVRKGVASATPSWDDAISDAFKPIIERIWQLGDRMDTVDQLKVQAFYGMRLRKNGEDLEAVAYLERAKTLLGEKPKHSWTPYIFEPLAYAYLNLGDFERARLTMSNAHQYCNKYQKRLDKNHLQFGILFHRMGLPDSSFYHFGKSLAHVDESHRSGVLASYAEAAIDFDSLSIADSLVTLMTKIEPEAFEPQRYYELVTKKFIKLGQLDSAETNMLRCVDAYIQEVGQSKDRQVAKRYLELAEIKNAQKQSNQALKYIDLGIDYLLPDSTRGPNELPKRGELYFENTFIDLFTQRAIAFTNKQPNGVSEDEFREAVKSIDYGLYINDALRNLYTMDLSREDNLFYNKKLVDAALHAIKHRYTEGGKSQATLDVVKKYLDRSKSILFRKKSSDRKHALTGASITNEFQRLNQTVDSLLDLTDKDASVERQAAVLKTQEKIDSILNARASQSGPKANQWSDYIEYHVGSSGVYVYASFKNERQFIYLGLTEILEQYVNEYREKMNAPALLLPLQSEQSLRELKLISQRLYRFLLEPLGALPESFTIIADDILLNINFETLVRDDKYIIETHEINYAFTPYYFNIQSSLANLPMTIICPQYSGTTAHPIASTRARLGSLPFAQNESASIRKIWNQADDEIIIKSDVDASTVYGSKDILHFAGHAYSSQEGALLALSDHDQLSADKIERQLLDKELVVLSACETGIGKIIYGEGSKSLGRSFKIAGVSRLVQSLWSVNDVTTSKLLTNFYEELKGGENVSRALRKSKLTYLEESPPEYHHPYYWAAFVAYDVPSPISYGRYGIIAFFAFLFIFIIYKTRTA